MLRCHAANPPGLCAILVGRPARKVNIRRLGLVYIAGEEQTDIIVLKSAGAGDAFQRHLNSTVLEQSISQPTFELPVRRWRLVEFGRIFINTPYLHRGLPGLEEDISGLDGTIVNMLEVKPGVKRNENIPVLYAVSE